MPAGLMPSPESIAYDRLGFFRWGRIADNILITTDGGDWMFLTEPEFAQLLAGEIAEGHPRFAELRSGGFLRDGLDLDALASRLARRVGHVARGPELHVVTLTRRGGDGTRAASASSDAAADLDPKTAERIVDLALQSTAPSVSFELQGHGGEPLLNTDGVRHFVDFARMTNKRAAGKTLRFTLVSNFSGMTEETAEWLIANDVAVRTWLDGPAELHDWSRKYTWAGAHADVVRWIAWFDRRYRELGRDADWRVDASVTTTRRTLSAWREVVDEYVTRGLRSIHFRPLSPVGLDADAWQSIGYTADEYIAFYERALAYILDLNRRGTHLAEATAAMFLNKILSSGDPEAGDIRSPCSAGTSEFAYDVDGRVFPNEEARRVDASGDPIFALGDVRQLALSDLVRHPTVRAIAAASLLDAQPMCADCWNKPFCGIAPVSSYVREGDLFGQRPRCFECREHKEIARTLFALLANDSAPETRAILERWTAASHRPR